MQQISIYTADQNKPITLQVAKVTSSVSTAGIKDHIEYEDENRNRGWIYINKESVIAIVISPPIKDASG